MENNFDCNPTLETERVILRKITLSDVDDVFEYASDNNVSRYTTWESHKTIEDTLAFLNVVINKYENMQPSDWGIVDKETNKFIGTCGWVYWNVVHNRAEIGYALSRSFWNKGLMTEAVEKVIDFGFNHMNLNRVEARCNVVNGGSERVMQKVGMKYEGLVREQMLIKGSYVNIKMYSILNQEWKARGIIST
jgi:[ribosomal protein S5]-alanine N-acetyltransferase